MCQELEKDSSEHISIKSVIKDFEKLTTYISERKQYNDQYDLPLLSTSHNAALQIHAENFERNKIPFLGFFYATATLSTAFTTLENFSMIQLVLASSLISLANTDLSKLSFFKKKIDIIGLPIFKSNDEFIEWSNNQFLENKILFFVNHRLNHLERYGVKIEEYYELLDLSREIKEMIAQKNNTNQLQYFDYLNQYAQKIFTIHYNLENKDFSKLEKLQSNSENILNNIKEDENRKKQKFLFKNNL